MARRDFSQADLATELSMSQAAVSRRLSGDVIFTIDELAKVARVLRVPLPELAALAEEPLPVEQAS